MKIRYFRVVHKPTGFVVSQHKRADLALQRAAREGEGFAAEHRDLHKDEWKPFDRWPTPEKIAERDAREEAAWRERKVLSPYFLTDMALPIGEDVLHASGMTLLELQALGFIEIVGFGL